MSDTNQGAEATTEAPKTSKSIVPSRYAGKYKDGGSDALALYINKECKGEAGFDYAKFFDLCKINGIDAAKVDHYAEQVESKRLGSQGRARMTLRNMLATLVRKDGKIKGLDGEFVELALPKVALTGAAKAAHDKQEAAGEPTAEGTH